ncbi:MAG: hypothetical protein LC623_05180, partial [Halobacteriales archaeon]|nr:hypothetical protein [Halobacteriales archaeon]
LKRARALTGGKRIAKRIRRPTKMGRIPDAEPIAKRGPSRPGPVRNVYRSPRQRPGRRSFPSQGKNAPSTFYPVGGGPEGPVSRRQR